MFRKIYILVTFVFVLPSKDIWFSYINRLTISYLIKEFFTQVGENSCPILYIAESTEPMAKHNTIVKMYIV